jgi:acetate kinase
MSGLILTLNAGSSSLKFALFPEAGETPMATGMVDRIGADATLKLKNAEGKELDAPRAAGFADHAQALDGVLAALGAGFPGLAVSAVGHRVVHGGPDFAAPLVIDDAVLVQVEKLSPFAPLHQPHNLAGIRAASAAFPQAVQIACFDTAFHRSHPFVNDVYGLPRDFFDKGVRRYGFHGLSYEYIAAALAEKAPLLASGRVVVAHLGNGASMCAMHDGHSIASTMGFSALDGLPMGTRSGQIDPGVLLYLMEQEGMDHKAISDLLYKQSGLLGISGISHDMRILEASDAAEARQAIDYFVSRIQRELAGMAAALGGIDALVFCAGIGENSRIIRARVCERLEWMGIELDHQRNAMNGPLISSELSRIQVLVIPTNEELVIARAARRLAAEARRTAA